MIKSIKCHQLCRYVFFCILLMCHGCAHSDAPAKAHVEQTLQETTTLEKSGDLANAVEELRVALTYDPGNSDILEKLNRLVAKRDQEAERHFRAGLAKRNNDLQGARKEFLAALRIRNDYPEAIAAIREIQYASAEAAIQGRAKKETRIATIRAPVKPEAVEEDEAAREEYSLDTAISSYEKGDYDTAIREFEKMKTRYPNDPDIQLYLDRALYNSGVAWYTKKDYRRAYTSFSKVPRGFEHVDEFMVKCRSALRIPEGDIPKSTPRKRR